MIIAILPKIIFSIIFLSIVLASIGSILIWKKHSFLSDSISHSCLIAAVLSSIINLPLPISMIFSAVITVFIVSILQRWFDSNLSTNLTTNFLISLALILGDIFPSSFNLSIVLFGDLLTINRSHLITVVILLIIGILLLHKYFNHIILHSFNKDISIINEGSYAYTDLIILIFASVAISLAIKITGALLTSTLLITPAATAKICSKTPIQMIILSTINISGLFIAIYFDLQPSAVIVMTNFIMLVLILILNKMLESTFKFE